MDPIDPANHSVVLASAQPPQVGATQIVEAAFAAELDQVLPLVEESLNQLGSADVPENLRPVLETLWNFFQAITSMRSGDFAAAIPALDSAVTEFDRLGFPDQRDVSIAMREYGIAVTALRNLNIGAAAGHYAQVKSFLQRAGKFSSKFEAMIALTEPDALFVAGLQALIALDYANAKVLINQAAQASETAAEKYFESNNPQFYTFMGQAQVHRTFFIYSEVSRDFNTFDFDGISARPDLSASARKACELLLKADLGSAQVRLLLLLAEGFVPLLETIQDLAALMKKLLASTVKADFKTLNPINEKISKANTHFSRGGAQTVSMVRSCEQLSNQIRNLERLARPDKKDFGKFAGLITCALFLPIFLVVSWANKDFHIGLGSYRLLGSCLMLSLVGGFGFGALRFKNFLTSMLKGNGGRSNRR